MKKYIILAIMALSATACVIDDGVDNSGRTGYRLMQYSVNMFNKFAKVPADDLIFMLTLDEFISLNEDEQNSDGWAKFRAEIEHYSNTLLKVPSKGMKIDTRGVSLRTPGSWWTITIYDGYRHSVNSGSDYYWNDRYPDAEEYGDVIRITCTAPDRYEIIDEKGGRETMLLTVEAVPSAYGSYDLSCSGSGSTARNKNGISAGYELSEFYFKRYSFSDDGTGNSSTTVTYEIETLDFRVDTYLDGEALDWCGLTVENHGGIQYSGNLELDYFFPID